MKISIVGFILMMVLITGGYSQDLVLKYSDTVVNNDTIYLTGTKSTPLIELRISVTNNRTAAVSLKLRKTEINVIEGAECSFCWGECYIPSVMVSLMQIAIAPGSTDVNSFVAEYRPFEMEGTSIVRYTFFDPSDFSLQHSFTVFYQIGGSGVPAEKLANELITVGPNPANQSIRIFLPSEMSGPHKASLINISGQLVAEKKLAEGQHEITWPVAGIPAGFYFLTMKDEKRVVSTHKICISH